MKHIRVGMGTSSLVYKPWIRACRLLQHSDSGLYTQTGRWFLGDEVGTGKCECVFMDFLIKKWNVLWHPFLFDPSPHESYSMVLCQRGWKKWGATTHRGAVKKHCRPTLAYAKGSHLHLVSLDPLVSGHKSAQWSVDGGKHFVSYKQKSRNVAPFWALVLYKRGIINITLDFFCWHVN